MCHQVVSGRYTKAADMWSVGVVLYIMLLGFPPFSVKHVCDLQDIGRRTVDWFSLYPDLPPVSAEAQALVRALLEADPEKRLTAQDALRYCPSQLTTIGLSLAVYIHNRPLSICIHTYIHRVRDMYRVGDR